MWLTMTVYKFYGLSNIIITSDISTRLELKFDVKEKYRVVVGVVFVLPAKSSCYQTVRRYVYWRFFWLHFSIPVMFLSV